MFSPKRPLEKVGRVYLIFASPRSRKNSSLQTRRLRMYYDTTRMIRRDGRASIASLNKILDLNSVPETKCAILSATAKVLDLLIIGDYYCQDFYAMIDAL